MTRRFIQSDLGILPEDKFLSFIGEERRKELVEGRDFKYVPPPSDRELLLDLLTALEALERRLGFEELSRDSSSLMMSDAEIEGRMYGCAMWDDPPKGYGRAKLLIWSRGELRGREIVAMNTRSELGAIIRFYRDLIDQREAVA